MIRLGTILLGLLWLTVVPAVAQMGGGPGPNCPPICPRGYDPKLEANYENLRLLKLLEAVDLNDEQANKFLPLFHTFRQDIRVLRQERNDLLDSLAAKVAGPSGDGPIQDILGKLAQNRTALQSREEAFKTASAGVLTMPQQAKLIIFQERFERDMLETLREFRKSGAPVLEGKR